MWSSLRVRACWVVTLAGLLLHLMAVPAGAGDLLLLQMQAKGIVSSAMGEDDRNLPVSRGDFLRMCLVAGGLVGEEFAGKVPSPFVDIDPGDRKREYYNAAYEYGLVAGYTDRTLRAQLPLRRSEAAAFLLRLRYILMPFTQPSTEQVEFLDDNVMSFSVRENARQAVVLGYMRRDDRLRFVPQRLVSYGEAMQMLQAFMMANGHYYDFSGRVIALARDGSFADVADNLSGMSIGIGINSHTIVTDAAGENASRVFRIGDTVRGMLDTQGNLTLVEIINAQ